MKLQTIMPAIVLLACAGCNTTEFTKTAAGDVTIKNKRYLWSTDSYEASWSTNGATLDVNKSGADAKAVVDIINATATAAGNALK